MSIVAIILARAGSGRVLGKNMSDFCGKPLLLWTIEQLQKVDALDSIWVSSDSADILELAVGNSCRAIFREAHLSGSKATSESAWIHAIDHIERCEGKIDTIISPQVTSPVREPEDMTEALHEFKENNYQFMYSCSPEGVENGSFYIFNIDSFKKLGSLEKGRFPRDTRAQKFYMKSWKKYEIDYPLDVKICGVLMRHFILNDRYFEIRDSEFPKDFYVEGYYQNKTDPDGVLRIGEEELDRKLEDSKEELAFINSLPPGNILDIGCGFGHLLSGVDSSWNKFGIEPNKSAAKQAEKYCKVFRGTLEQTRYHSDFFDVVVLYHVIEHLENPIESIIEIRRILKPNGTLILCTPDFKCELAQRFGPNYRLLHDKTHINLFGALDLFRLLTDLEFRVEKVAYPYFNTIHFTKENLLRLFDTTKISPPFYGNLVSIYSYKRENI